MPIYNWIPSVRHILVDFFIDCHWHYKRSLLWIKWLLVNGHRIWLWVLPVRRLGDEGSMWWLLMEQWWERGFMMHNWDKRNFLVHDW